MTIETTNAMPTSTTNGAMGTGTASGPTTDQLAAEIRGAQNAVAASVVVTQLRNSFDLPKDGFAGAAITVAPALFLNPASQGSGLGAFLNAKVLAVAAVAGIVFAQDISQKKYKYEKISDIQFTRWDRKLAVGSQSRFIVQGFDERGAARPVENATFASSAQHIAEVDSRGVVTAVKQGVATIKATFEDKSDLVTVEVTPPPYEEDRPEVHHRDTRET